ncbi:MAG: hypothetical protein V9E98_04835 [Candidatus Nanopelagicales bacterium]
MSAKTLKGKRVRLTITASPAAARRAEIYRRSGKKWALVQRAPTFPSRQSAAVVTVVKRVSPGTKLKTVLPATASATAASDVVRVKSR